MKPVSFFAAIALFVMNCVTQVLAQPNIGNERQPTIWKNVTTTAAEVKMAKRAAIDQLKDPESAKFDKIWALSGSNGARTVCGYVNAKNSYGGYTGKKMFTLVDADRVAFEDDDVFGSLFPGICLPRTVK